MLFTLMLLRMQDPFAKATGEKSSELVVNLPKYSNNLKVNSTFFQLHGDSKPGGTIDDELIPRVYSRGPPKNP